VRPFVPSSHAVREVAELERELLKMPNFEGLADITRRETVVGEDGTLIPIGSEHIADSKSRRIFFDALLELHRLVEEYRFHVALAHLLVLDVGPKVDAQLAEPRRSRTEEAVALGPLPDELRAMLLPLFAHLPSAAALFDDPHVVITGGRRFSAWVAGQMLDSGFIRGIAAVDRIATIAWARAERPLPTRRSGAEFLPEFTKNRLLQIEDEYGGQDGWTDLLELSEHRIFLEVRRVRDSFTHARRFASELHGEGFVATYAGPTYEGVDAEMHLALGLAFYSVILVPAIGAARRLLALPPES
jgi:hypothetical protein